MYCRYGNYEDFLVQMTKTEGGIEKFSQGYKIFGPQVNLKRFLNNNDTSY